LFGSTAKTVKSSIIFIAKLFFSAIRSFISKLAKCRLFLFFTKKGCINEYYPEGFKVGLERYKVLSESKINYDPYLDFKQMKVEKKKKDIEKDFH
jgi:hypothetical protein